MAVDYIPLSTSPSSGNDDDELDRDWIQEASRRKGQWAPLMRSRYLIVALSAGTLGLVLAMIALSGSSPPPPPPVELIPADNPYFTPGKIWDHNDEVTARLDRCASLGLLRNTSLPQPPLPEDEERALIAEGCGTNETTIVILASLWASEAYKASSPTGEVIYAQSVIQTLNANNYAYMFSNLGWNNYQMYKTMEVWRRHRWNVRFVLLDPLQADACWKEEGCLKTEANPDGIEAWRLLSFWYWDDPGNPLGPQFTLSPFPRNDNFHLQMSIEPTCKRLPYLDHALRPRPHHAYLLSKQMRYLEDNPTFSWTIPGLAKIQQRLGIKIVAGMVNDRPDTGALYEESGLTNVGQLNKTEFYKQLAKSGVLVGVGKPRISPSPWDALCMGVPFINPVLQWDEKDPNNRAKWHAQQWHMTDMKPPYVYHVHAHDLKELERTLKKAIATPIKSYIPDHMKFDHVRAVMAGVVEGDWRGKAEVILQERISSGEGELFLL